MRIRNLVVVFLFGLIWLGGDVVTVHAQDTEGDNPACAATRTYSSWLNTLDSLAGTIQGSITESARGQTTVNGKFAIAVGDDIRTTNYFFQIETKEQSENDQSSGNFTAGFVNDNLIAELNSRNTEWSVRRRDEFSGSRSLEDAFMQADNFLMAVFQQLQLVSLSDCRETEVIGGRDAVHYHLNIPPFMGSMLISQLTGGPVGDDITLGTIMVDYWFDEQANYISKMEITVEATDNGQGNTVQGQAVLELTSVNNISLIVPQYIRVLAMQQGIIEPDFAPEFVVEE